MVRLVSLTEPGTNLLETDNCPRRMSPMSEFLFSTEIFGKPKGPLVS